MTLWLMCRSNADNIRKRYNVSASPCPIISATGIQAVDVTHHELWDDGRPAPRSRVPKPPYRVPTMTEIAAVEPNGFSVVSTFSGCGGSSLGYRMAGFRIVWANEFVPAAREVYRANWPDTPLDERDIRAIQPDDILSATGLRRGEIDLLDGSPPCASFSTMGRRQEHWGLVRKYSDTEQRTDDLFFEFVRMIRGLQPKVFVAENVAGLVKGAAKGYFLEILAALKSCRYVVEARVLDAQWLGVPQSRSRLIFLGVRRDLRLTPAWPRPLPYRYSLAEALPSLARECRQRDANEPRRLTIDEAKRLCSFPPDFKLAGSFSKQWERLGRAVPPLMMHHIAIAVRDRILSTAATAA